MKNYGWLHIYKGSGYGFLIQIPLPDMSDTFKTINCPLGTDPVASTPNDILNLTSADGSVVIQGDATTDTVDFSISASLGAYLPLAGGILTGYLGLPTTQINANATIQTGVLISVTDTTSPVIVTLGDTLIGNRGFVIVKDDSGEEFVNPITITCQSAQLIDNQTSVKITAGYGYYVFLCAYSKVFIVGQSPDQAVVVYDSDTTLRLADSHKLHTNQGAAATVNLTIPQAKIGMEFTFVVLADFPLRILFPVASSGYLGTTLLNPSTVLQSDKAGSLITLFGMASGIYLVKEQTGVWEII